MSVALIGVDIGTTSFKAVAFAPDGTQLARVSAATPTSYPQPDWAEFKHTAVWTTLVGILRELVRDLGNRATPAAIAFTGMAEAGLPLNESGEPLYPAISWFDRRVLQQLENWQTKIGEANTARITGLPLGPAAGILRLLWLRDHFPDLFNQTRTWLNLPDYAAFRLCGAKVTEYSLASRMMVLDLATRQWSDELLQQVELDAGIFGELASSAIQIGKVHQEAADLTGLPCDLPVCTAGHDHLCAAVGLGVTDAGEIFDSIGTAEALVVSLPGLSDDPAVAASGIAQGIHVLPQRYYAITGNAFGGGSFDWARRLLHGGADDRETAYDALFESASQASAGSGGVFFLPHLRQANPPTLDPHSRGAFIGLSSGSRPKHLARAVLEGLAFEYQRILDAVSECFGLANQRLVATGGGTRNRLFMQIKSDVSGLPIVIPDVEEATCLGAALAAGVGAGIFDSYEDALSQTALSENVVEPDMEKHQLYRERYETVFVHLYESLKAVNHNISNWVNPAHEKTKS
ncbi:MAG: FGGY-family carbohydrate kinase [Gammaproteobacteria bacterium]